MLSVAAIALVALTFINFYITRRLVHPAFIYSAIWATQLLALEVIGNKFISPSIEVLLIVVLGATSFSLGSFLSLFYVSKESKLVRPREIRKSTVLILIIIILVTLCVFEQYQIFINLVSDENIEINLIYARTLMSEHNEDVYGIYKYGSAIALGAMLVLQIQIARTETNTRLLKYFFFYLLLASIFMAILSTGRGPIAFIFLQIGIAYILKFENKTLNLKFAGVTVGFLFLVFLIFWIMGSAMGKADESAEKAFANLIDYLFSSIPALSAYIEQYPIQTIGGEWGTSTFRILLAITSKAGFTEPVQSLVQESLPVPHLTNLYTTYLQYSRDFGWAGILIIPAIVGFFHGSLFRWAMIDRRNDFAFFLLVFSYLPLLQSVFQETHFSLMSSWLQFILIGLILTQVKSNIKNHLRK